MSASEQSPTEMTAAALRRRAQWALFLLVPAPSFGVFMFLVVAPGAIGASVYALMKAHLLLFPLLWWRYVEKRPWSLSLLPPTKRREGWTVGVVSGVLIAGVILGAYFILGQEWIGVEGVLAKAREGGLDRWPNYLGLVTYLTFINSLLEEYVWRWFVYVQLERWLGRGRAVVGAALAFTLHHVIALTVQFDLRVTILGSVGVFVGGLIWSWCYGRYRSIWPGYVSHIGADAAIFWVGAQLLF